MLETDYVVRMSFSGLVEFYRYLNREGDISSLLLISKLIRNTNKIYCDTIFELGVHAPVMDTVTHYGYIIDNHFTER